MDKELTALQNQIIALKKEFAVKIKSLEDQLGSIQKQQSDDLWNQTQTASRSVSRPASTVTPQTAPQTQPDNSPANKQWNRPAVSPPLISNLRKAKAALAVKLGLFELILSFFGPFAVIIRKLSSVYQHYQSQGKAPVFFMTAAGVSALVLGFGYLMQYSFSAYLSEVGKIVVAYVVAIAITAGGILFTRKYDSMKEYGSSIIGLGIILSYLCTYFSSAYYLILPTGLSLIVMAVITACAYAIALLFETRIVAVVTLIGGAFAPVLLGSIEQPPTLYFSYLLLLVIFMLHLSQRIQWPVLAQTSMLISISLIQYCLNDYPYLAPTSTWLVALIHGFFYAFAYFALRDVGRLNTVSKLSLFVITANLLFLLISLEQIVGDPQTYGILLIANTAVWLLCAISPQKIFALKDITISTETRNSMRVLALLSAGVLAGVGILAVTDPLFLGLIWGIEGLMLLYLGARFNYFSIRVEAYLVLAIALAQSSFDAIDWVVFSLVPAPLILQLELGFGWMNLLVATSLIGTAVFILHKYSQQHLRTDSKIYRISNEALSVYLSATLLLSIGVFADQWIWVFALLPLFLLIFRAKRHSLKFTEYFGFAHYLLLLVPIVVSADQAGSFRFAQQNLVGQFARVEAFLSLWAIAEFYSRFHPKGQLIRLALILRQVFYCLIPIFFLPSIIRNNIEYFPLVIWGSSATALFLYHQFKFKSLRVETMILVAISCITAIIACAFVEFEHWDGYGLSSLGLGVLFFSLVMWLWKGFERRPKGKEAFLLVRQGIRFLFSLSFYYFGLVVFILSYGFTQSPLLAGALSSVYFTFIIIKTPVINPLRRNFSRFYIVTWVIIGLTNFSFYVSSISIYKDIVSQSIAVIIAMSCAATLVYLPRLQLILVWRKLLGHVSHLWFFHLLSVVTYISLIESWLEQNEGPAISITIVAHATIVLFQTLKVRFQRLIWLASGLYAIAALKIILVDMVDFSLVEKIIAFMVIGALLLAAAYQYQRMRRTHVPRIT